ncbi:MAG: hypothetical protein FJ134_04810 [Deltaproteobacteria bacterium]|nr:hypothetical protein [Deltaproteobacteria bacterium]
MNSSTLHYLTRKKLLVAWICIILATIIVSSLFYHREQLREREARAAQAQERLARISELQHHIAAAENLAAEYVITGDPHQLEPFQAAVRDIDQALLEGGEWLNDSPPKSERLRELRPLIQERLAILERLMDIRRQKGWATEELGAVVAQGKAVDDRLDRFMARLQQEEKHIAFTEGAKTKQKIRQWVWAFTLGVSWIFAMVLFVLYLFYHEIRVRQQAEEKLMDSQERLRSLASQITLAEERERRRIAVLLHDQIGQKLAVTYIKLGQLGGMPPPVLDTAIQEIRQVIKQAIQENKSLTFKISSPILYELGLEAAVEWLTEELQSRHGTVAYFETDRHPKPVEENLRILLYQAVNELLLNVVKHSRARHVQVSIWREGDRLRLGVYDDGVGFNPAAIRARWGKREGGFGLFSIRERLRPFGGLLEVDSKPGFGTQVVITVPLKNNIKPPMNAD